MAKKSKSKYSFKYTIDELKPIVEEVCTGGQWFFENHYWQLKFRGKTYISFYPSTKALMFQGIDEVKSFIETAVIEKAIESNALR